LAVVAAWANTSVRRQAAFVATIQTLEAHYARTDNAACTDNSLEISHLSVQIYTNNSTEHSRLKFDLQNVNSIFSLEN